MESEAGVYHVINRGHYRADIFRTEKTKVAFLQCLQEACAKTGWQVHAWCVMSNHDHSGCLDTEGQSRGGHALAPGHVCHPVQSSTSGTRAPFSRPLQKLGRGSRWRSRVALPLYPSQSGSGRTALTRRFTQQSMDQPPLAASSARPSRMVSTPACPESCRHTGGHGGGTKEIPPVSRIVARRRTRSQGATVRHDVQGVDDWGSRFRQNRSAGAADDDRTRPSDGRCHAGNKRSSLAGRIDGTSGPTQTRTGRREAGAKIGSVESRRGCGDEGTHDGRPTAGERLP